MHKRIFFILGITVSSAQAMKSETYTNEQIRQNKAKDAYLLCIKDIVFKQHDRLCVKVKEILTQPLLFQEFKAILNAKELQPLPENKTLFSIVHNILYIQSKESLMEKGKLISMHYPQHPEFSQDHIQKTTSLSQEITTFVRTTQSPEYYNKWQNYMAAIHKARSSHASKETGEGNKLEENCSKETVKKHPQESIPSPVPLLPRINSNTSKQIKIQLKKNREKSTNPSKDSPEPFKKPTPRPHKRIKYNSAIPSSSPTTEYYSPTLQRNVSSPVLEDEALIQSYYSSPINTESSNYSSPQSAKPSPSLYYSPSEELQNLNNKDEVEHFPTLDNQDIDTLILTVLDHREIEKRCLAPSINPETPLPIKRSDQRT